MKIYKIEAIRIPGAVTRFGDDLFKLMYFAENGIKYLNNGRRIAARQWFAPSFDLQNPFYTLDEFETMFHTNKYWATDSEYQDNGPLTPRDYLELVHKAFASAKTIEELHGMSVRKFLFCNTSEDFYNLCMDNHLVVDSRFDYCLDFYFDRGVDNIDEDYLSYATQPFYVIRMNDGFYLGYETRKICAHGVAGAAQFDSEMDALAETESKSYLLNDCGFEVIKIDGVERTKAIPLLHIYN